MAFQSYSELPKAAREHPLFQKMSPDEQLLSFNMIHWKPDTWFDFIVWFSCSVDESQITAHALDTRSIDSSSTSLIGDKHIWDYHVKRSDKTQTWLRMHFSANVHPRTTDKYIGHYFIDFTDNAFGHSYVMITYSLYYGCYHKCDIFEKRIEVKPGNDPLKRKVFDLMILSCSFLSPILVACPMMSLLSMLTMSFRADSTYLQCMTLFISATHSCFWLKAIRLVWLQLIALVIKLRMNEADFFCQSEQR